MDSKKCPLVIVEEGNLEKLIKNYFTLEFLIKCPIIHKGSFLLSGNVQLLF